MDNPRLCYVSLELAEGKIQNVICNSKTKKAMATLHGMFLKLENLKYQIVNKKYRRNCIFSCL